MYLASVCDAIVRGGRGAISTIAFRAPAGRFGDPEEFGAACAFLCSTKAGFITGQNILLDGGAYPGTL